MNDHGSKPLSVTIDLNIFYDKAEEREGSEDFDQIIEHARTGQLQLFFTATTDFEDRSGMATRILMKLVGEGVLNEDPNAGSPREYMPDGPGTHLIEGSIFDEVFCAIWPTASRINRSVTNKENDVFGLLAHKLNGRKVYLTRDKEILRKAKVLTKRFQIVVMSPKELLSACPHMAGKERKSVFGS
jgi:predicted RNA-binding protein YlxR (DUF448 family)